MTQPGKFNNNSGNAISGTLSARSKRSAMLFAVLLILALPFIVYSFRSMETLRGEESGGIDSLEYPPGHPVVRLSALEQLKNFPLPRYRPHNALMRLFNWFNPVFLGGGGQPGIKNARALMTGYPIQEELALHWNYNIVIYNASMASSEKAFQNPDKTLAPAIQLANKYPEIPLGITTYWGQIHPSSFGYASKRPNVLRKDFADSSLYIRDAGGHVLRKILSFAAPDSLFIQDGQFQRRYLENILAKLTRPVTMINENGEEPPGAYGENFLENDAKMVAQKKSMGVEHWKEYISIRKKHFRKLYAAQFMDSLPLLKNTLFTYYQIEGGPIDRFDWNISKSTSSPIRGRYYSTPDFYPRRPDNWKNWQGAWHGWKWISDGRKEEVESGDTLFSPFVAAGWSVNPEKDMRPAQWLGLLKSLGVVGAEFYYVCHFSLKQPFPKPQDYIWQAAMPAYAQAITSRYEDLFFNGNVCADERGSPLVTYPVEDDDVLVTVRKHNEKKVYAICGTVQNSSNMQHTAPLKKNVHIVLGKHTLTFQVRRQGSVYIFDDTHEGDPVFYQLDAWHEHTHPWYWKKDIYAEAEVYDNAEEGVSIKTQTNAKDNYDFTQSVSYVALGKRGKVAYAIDTRRDSSDLRYLWLRINVPARCDLAVSAGAHQTKVAVQKTNGWQWEKITLKEHPGSSAFTLSLQCLEGVADVDKLVLSSSAVVPDIAKWK